MLNLMYKRHEESLYMGAYAELMQCTVHSHRVGLVGMCLGCCQPPHCLAQVLTSALRKLGLVLDILFTNFIILRLHMSGACDMF